MTLYAELHSTDYNLLVKWISDTSTGIKILTGSIRFLSIKWYQLFAAIFILLFNLAYSFYKFILRWQDYTDGLLFFCF